jgi:hypothetical protein
MWLVALQSWKENGKKMGRRIIPLSNRVNFVLAKKLLLNT